MMSIQFSIGILSCLFQLWMDSFFISVTIEAMAIDSGQFRGERRVMPEEEIRELERKLEEKKRELAEQGGGAPPEKEIFREVLREHIERPGGESKPQLPTHGIAEIEKKKDAPLPVPERDEKLRALIERALTRSIADAVDAAYRESPYLLDALHDRLVDEYYDKLIALRKIDAL